MNCPACGNPVAPGERFCRVCGHEVAAPAPAQPTVPATTIPAAPAETSGKAIVSLICGLLFFFFPASILAIIFGHISYSQIRKSGGRLKGEGLAIAGMVLGYGGVVFIPIILIIAAIAIPNLLRARQAANESSAVASVRTVVTAEMTYAETHHDTGYTCNLSDLSELLDSQLVAGQKNGYNFELLGCAPGADGPANIQFRVVASPVTPSTTGVRAFCSDESAVIKVDASGSASGCVESGSPLR